MSLHAPAPSALWNQRKPNVRCVHGTAPGYEPSPYVCVALQVGFKRLRSGFNPATRRMESQWVTEWFPVNINQGWQRVYSAEELQASGVPVFRCTTATCNVLGVPIPGQHSKCLSCGGPAIGDGILAQSG